VVGPGDSSTAGQPLAVSPDQREKPTPDHTRRLSLVLATLACQLGSRALGGLLLRTCRPSGNNRAPSSGDRVRNRSMHGYRRRLRHSSDSLMEISPSSRRNTNCDGFKVAEGSNLKHHWHWHWHSEGGLYWQGAPTSCLLY
jgi:hypothetical protein